MKNAGRHVCLFLASLLWGLGTAQTCKGQVVGGAITDASTASPLVGVEVMIFSGGRNEAGSTLTDADGRYEFVLATAGDVTVQARHIGYETLVSPLIAVTRAEPVTLDFRLDAEAVSLPGLDVEVDRLEIARREYALLGVNLLDVGRRFLDPDFVASRWASRDVGDLIESRALPGVSVTRSEYGGPPCVALQRGRTGAGMWSCAQVAIDGQLVNRSMLLDLPLDAISSVLVMTPSEATLVFGTGASGGVVAILTKARAR